MASGFGFSSAPSWIIRAAPPSGSPGGAPSSAGWKMKTMVPAMSAFIPASTSAAPISMATWASWPQAWATGTVLPI